MVKLDRKLNLVVPIEREDGPIYVHSTPISLAVFNRHFIVMSKAFAAIWDQGLHITVGPRIAALMVRQMAERLGIWEGPEGVEIGLIAEIKRLANVVFPGANGWEMIPLQLAVDQGRIDITEEAEVLGAITFFTLESSIRPKALLPAYLEAMCKAWRSQTTSLDAMEFAASLPISTPEGNSGETAKASSIPV